MKTETETAVRSIASIDPEITKEMMEHAIDILRGNVRSEDDLVHVVKRKEVMKILSISRRTLDYYLKRGYLDRVYGGGRINAMGVSRESLLRYGLTPRSPVPCRAASPGYPVPGDMIARFFVS